MRSRVLPLSQCQGEGERMQTTDQMAVLSRAGESVRDEHEMKSSCRVFRSLEWALNFSAGQRTDLSRSHREPLIDI